MRKNLPPLLTHGHTEVDARSLAFLSQRHSALSRGFVNGQSAFSLPFGSQLDLSRDGDERRGGRTGRRTHSQTPAHTSGAKLGKFLGDFPHKFLGF